MDQHQNLRVQTIEQQGDRILSITWLGGKTQIWDVVELRRKCPCASCIDEWTREPILKPESISENVRPKKIKSVGRYAIGMDFTDGHNTGIYTYDYLHKLGS